MVNENRIVWLKRELLSWRWVLCKDKTVVLFDKDKKKHITLDKVRLMSFMKFAVSALDKMRIEEGKLSRIRVKKIKEKARERIKKKIVVGKLINVRANIKNNITRS